MPLTAFYDLPAPAKLNTFLHVVGRRADGYHLLQSLFVLIDWVDVLHIERRDDGALHRHDLGAALPADDLTLRAARALQQASGTSLGADIHLDKRVPWAACWRWPRRWAPTCPSSLAGTTPSSRASASA